MTISSLCNLYLQGPKRVSCPLEASHTPLQRLEAYQNQRVEIRVRRDVETSTHEQSGLIHGSRLRSQMFSLRRVLNMYGGICGLNPIKGHIHRASLNKLLHPSTTNQHQTPSQTQIMQEEEGEEEEEEKGQLTALLKSSTKSPPSSIPTHNLIKSSGTPLSLLVTSSIDA